MPQHEAFPHTISRMMHTFYKTITHQLVSLARAPRYALFTHTLLHRYTNSDTLVPMSRTACTGRLFHHSWRLRGNLTVEQP
jgi:hypothetical protein